MSRTPNLVHASKLGDLVTIQSLLRSGTPEQSEIIEALFPASQNGDLNVVQCLVEVGRADPHSTDERRTTTPMHTACQMGRFSVLRYLASQEGGGKNVQLLDKNGYPPHILACCNGHYEIVKYLIQEYKVDPDQRFGHENMAPIHWAAKINHPPMAEFLLFEADAQVNNTARNGTTALHLACRRPLFASCHPLSKPVIDILLQNGADIDAQDEEGQTPLLEAVKYNRLDVARRLLEYQPDLHLRNDEGQHALAKACSNKNAPMVQLLLANGASVMDTQGLYLISLACGKQEGQVDLVHTDIAWLLLTARVGQEQLRGSSTTGGGGGSGCRCRCRCRRHTNKRKRTRLC